ncbi:MAG: CNNM domain-containing protein [Kiritimatiellia bacterium]
MQSILILSSSIAIVVSFLCSLAESLLLSLNPLTLNRLQAERPRAAQSWRRLKQNIARPITAILVLNTVAHTGGATVAGGAFAEIYGENNIWIFSVFFTVIVLFGTEILPKIIGVSFRNQLAPYAGPLLEGLTRLMLPFIWVSEHLFRRLTTEGEPDQITTADLVTLAALARSGKSINLEQENIIVNAVRLGHTPITRAMIPPDRIRFISTGDTPDSVLALARQSEHTRYPVSRSTEPRDIFAYIVTNKALPVSNDEIGPLVAKAKPIHTVNHRDTLMMALRSMLQNKEHLLSVVDDRKQCVGIVTLEDIAGELLSADIDQFK